MMSLKGFHIFFISLSILCAFAFSAWFFWGTDWESETLRAAGGIGSLLVGIGLIAYGVRFLEKFKNLRSS